MVLLTAISPWVWGHKVILDVFVSGAVVEGELGFSNGEMANQQMISVYNTMGQELAQVHTDKNGFFSYTPGQKVDQVFVADLGAGHLAKATLSASELTSNMQLSSAPVAQQTEAESPRLPATQLTSEQVNMALELQKLSVEIRQMRRALKAYKEQHDWQTILGGMGYILGLVGLGYYFAARRRLQDK
jgi:nickel transport protein